MERLDGFFKNTTQLRNASLTSAGLIVERTPQQYRVDEFVLRFCSLKRSGERKVGNLEAEEAKRRLESNQARDIEFGRCLDEWPLKDDQKKEGIYHQKEEGDLQRTADAK